MLHNQSRGQRRSDNPGHLTCQIEKEAGVDCKEGTVQFFFFQGKETHIHTWSLSKEFLTAAFREGLGNGFRNYHFIQSLCLLYFHSGDPAFLWCVLRMCHWWLLINYLWSHSIAVTVAIGTYLLNISDTKRQYLPQQQPVYYLASDTEVTFLRLWDPSVHPLHFTISNSCFVFLFFCVCRTKGLQLAFWYKTRCCMMINKWTLEPLIPCVLASHREKQGTQEHTTASFSNIAIHVGTNNVQMK